MNSLMMRLLGRPVRQLETYPRLLAVGVRVERVSAADLQLAGGALFAFQVTLAT